MNRFDFLIVGGGIFGLSSAVTLAKRNYKVGLINPNTIPHHLAASTDVTKAVRMEYGSDTEYFKMAEFCIDRWHEWNTLFGVQLYRETGFLMLCKDSIKSERQAYEKYSYKNLLRNGHSVERLGPRALKKRFPAINTDIYTDAVFNPRAGYVASALALEKLADYARSLGVRIFEGQTAERFVIKNGRLQAVKTREGATFTCGHAQIAAGAHTRYLLPELQPYIKTTGHPVFWLKPKNTENFVPPRLCVFTADISNSGWYGFPFLPKHGIVKVAKHTNGMELHPDKDDRRVNDTEVKELRGFLKETLPELADAPLVYTRRCLYTDTLDGHFWIDNHPAIKGLSVSTGGSGHGLKMAPVIGKMGADVAEGRSHRISRRYLWRHLTVDTLQAEEARYVVDRKI